MRRLLALGALLPAAALAAGLLVPTSGDPAQLVLRDFDIRVAIDGPHAEVRFEQIWENRADHPVEGRYELPLPAGASLVGFSLWEGERRLHGVVVEKTRGRRLYEDLKAQAIDPGLVEQGDDGDEGLIVLRVAPVPAHGTTRIQLTYDQILPIASLTSQLVVPLAPGEGKKQTTAALRVAVDVKPDFALRSATATPWFAAPPSPEKGFTLAHQGKNVNLDRDLVLGLTYASPPGVVTRVAAYRDNPAEAGFFASHALLPAPRGARPAHDVVVALDASPSLLGDELGLAVAALEELVGKRLQKGDRFGVVVFNDEARAWKPALTAWTPAAAAEAVAFVRASYVAGGTDLVAGLGAAAKLVGQGEVVLVTDGRPTRGELEQKKLEKALAVPAGVRVFTLGVGDQADDLLLERLATRSGGAYLRRARAAGELELSAFFDKLGSTATTLATDLPATRDVYAPAQVWAGSDALVLGRYTAPSASLPARDVARPWVGRLWAAARVRDLLGRIRDDGERQAWIDEIIALARRYGLVTPYTSFIAAPRALLRPRTFQAGDPILRVETDDDIRGVVALFPWGLTLPLEPVEAGIWETRFLAPAWMTDGEHRCTLVLTGAHGEKLREEKTFTVDSTPPHLEVFAPPVARAGEPLRLEADADPDVRTLTARLGDGPPFALRWSPADKRSVGALEVPAELPAGRHELHIVAEDFARNTTLVTLSVEVRR